MSEKTKYQIEREKKYSSREKACMDLKHINYDRLVRIEQGALPTPFEVMELADAFSCAELCNHYCTKECDIGREFVPEIKIDSLAEVVLGMLASLNSIEEKKNRLIEITADGIVDENEVAEFIRIEREIKKISIAAQAMDLWTKQMLQDEKVDKATYEKLINDK